jgi:hypothetical protein
MSDYTQMSSHLGLDLKTHDALLSIPGGAYQDTFLSQKERPGGTKCFDFVMSEVHGLRIKELMDAKAAIPVLRLETDYSQEEDAGQLKTRTEAFRERIQTR